MQERKDKWSVGQWMTPNPQSITPNTSVRSAFIKMRQGGFRHLLVMENNKLLGIITDRDLRRPDISKEPDGWHEYYNITDDYEVRYIMTTNVKTVSPSDPLERAMQMFLQHKIGALPVLDRNGVPIGILSSYDVLKAFNAVLEIAGDWLRRRDWENLNDYY